MEPDSVVFGFVKLYGFKCVFYTIVSSPLQDSNLSTKMITWATKFRFWQLKFKSGGQHDHQCN